MTADASPLPGEPLTGRHRPERLYPEGLTPQRAAARCGLPTRGTHNHHSLETTA